MAAISHHPDAHQCENCKGLPGFVLQVNEFRIMGGAGPCRTLSIHSVPMYEHPRMNSLPGHDRHIPDLAKVVEA